MFLREAFGPLAAFLCGWTFILVIQAGLVAAVSIAFAKYLGVLWPAIGEDKFLWHNEDMGIGGVSVPIPWMNNESVPFFKPKMFAISTAHLVAVAVTVSLTFINTFGVEHGRWVQNLFTVAKTAGLALLIVLGLTVAANSEAIQQNTANVWDGIYSTESFKQVLKITPSTTLAIVMLLSGAMVGALFSADAWGNVTFIASEVKNPQHFVTQRFSARRSHGDSTFARE